MPDKTKRSRCNLRDFILDLLDFMEEQIELAKASPEDQLAAIDAASGVIPLLHNKLDDDLAGNFVLLLQNKFDSSWRDDWNAFAKLKSPEEFRKEADNLVMVIFPLLRKLVLA